MDSIVKTIPHGPFLREEDHHQKVYRIETKNLKDYRLSENANHEGEDDASGEELGSEEEDSWRFVVVNFLVDGVIAFFDLFLGESTIQLFL